MVLESMVPAVQTPTLARESLYTCGYLGVVPVLRDALVQRQYPEGTATIAAAITGGLFAATASQPPDTIKTRMQVWSLAARVAFQSRACRGHARF